MDEIDLSSACHFQLNSEYGEYRFASDNSVDYQAWVKVIKYAFDVSRRAGNSSVQVVRPVCGDFESDSVSVGGSLRRSKQSITNIRDVYRTGNGTPPNGGGGNTSGTSEEGENNFASEHGVPIPPPRMSMSLQRTSTPEVRGVGRVLTPDINNTKSVSNRLGQLRMFGSLEGLSNNSKSSNLKPSEAPEN